MAAKKSASARYFPEELIIKILVCVVSVKELVQYKTVCKLWLSIISSPSFIKSHLHRAIVSAPTPTLLTILKPPSLQLQPFTMFTSNFPQDDYKQAFFTYQQLFNKALDDTNARDLSKSPVHFCRVDLPTLLWPAKVVNCCNGIICLFDALSDVLYLWNPSIRMFKKLPAPPKFMPRFLPSFPGFYYDSVSDDYKVVMKLVPSVLVYSTKSDSWTEFQPSIMYEKNGYLTFTKPNIIVNGVLYFDYSEELFSFDLHNEVSGIVKFPSAIKGRRSEVLDFEGYVAVVFELESGGMDLCTLDNISSGDQVSWTKKFSIEDDDSKTKLYLTSYLGAGKFNGQKLLYDKGIFFSCNILYDYKKKEAKYIGLGEFNKVHATLKFNETLVSLDGFERTE